MTNATDTRPMSVFLMSLPAGEHWRLHDDLDLIVLNSSLDRSQQNLALIEAGRPDLIPT